MKKFVAFLLSCSFLLTLSACHKADNSAAQVGQSKSDTVSNAIADNNEYEKVEITLDNYQEYFEITTQFYADQDEFGDYTGQMWYAVYFAIKDGFEVETGYEKSDIKIKYDYTPSIHGFTFNKETGEWKLEESTLKYEDEHDISATLGEIEDVKYGVMLGMSAYISERSGAQYEYYVEVPENINIKRIMGTLYVKKTA